MTTPFEEAEAAIDLTEFHEWLQETAERESTSTDSLLGQLVSTYWILSELTELVDEGAYEGDAEGEATSPPTEEPRTESSSDESRSELVEVVDSIAEMLKHRDPSESGPSHAVDPSVLELIRATNREEAAPSQPPAQPMSYRDVRAMVDDIKSVEDEVTDLSHQVSGTLAEVQASVDSLTETVERNASTIDTLEMIQTDRGDRLEAVESRFDASYGDIRKILSQLIDRTNEQEARLETVIETYEADIGRLKAAEAAREHLAELKTDAARRDITTAECEACEQPFNVGLLGKPTCPHCEREIEGFGAKRGALGRSYNVARVKTFPTTNRHSDLSDRVDRATRTVPNANAETTDDLLEWWESASER